MGEEFRRYAALARAAGGRALTGVAPDAGADRDRAALLGVTPALLLLGDGRGRDEDLAPGLRLLALAARGPRDEPVLLADGSGHRRDVYYPFVLRLYLRAFAARYEAMPQSAWSACEDAIPAAVDPVRAVERYADTPPPPPLVALTLWQAVAIGEQAALLGRDVDTEMIDGVVHHALQAGGAGGGVGSVGRPLHPHADNESLDAWTYRELSGLHALAAAAVLRRNQAWARRVEEVAMYHLEHTQPDYTTTQPWGLFAFAWSIATRPFADQQLLDAESVVATAGRGPEVAQALPMVGMLLADAADALGRLGWTRHGGAP